MSKFNQQNISDSRYNKSNANKFLTLLMGTTLLWTLVKAFLYEVSSTNSPRSNLFRSLKVWISKRTVKKSASVWIVKSLVNCVKWYLRSSFIISSRNIIQFFSEIGISLLHCDVHRAGRKFSRVLYSKPPQWFWCFAHSGAIRKDQQLRSTFVHQQLC